MFLTSTGLITEGGDAIYDNEDQERLRNYLQEINARKPQVITRSLENGSSSGIYVVDQYTEQQVLVAFKLFLKDENRVEPAILEGFQSYLHLLIYPTFTTEAPGLHEKSFKAVLPLMNEIKLFDCTVFRNNTMSNGDGSNVKSTIGYAVVVTTTATAEDLTQDLFDSLKTLSNLTNGETTIREPILTKLNECIWRTTELVQAIVQTI
ncbi:hypothetical protein RhiXN_10689 [Rhizoctonia solani]|nr:uncharacterized protein RhiXN_10689 [Rhizoctonia solani]KAF8749882.1 hypothetical protein RHS01_09765 [Rhizoctonia solani]QRW25613.1 hypothetical protein RhiXN_10689 [Rhizoctonia solani]